MGPPNEVSCTGSEPSASQIQISMAPERVDSKARRLPSGENAGWRWLRLEDTSLSGGPPARVESESGSRQMLVL
jgi:hypothetical protein